MADIYQLVSTSALLEQAPAVSGAEAGLAYTSGCARSPVLQVGQRQWQRVLDMVTRIRKLDMEVPPPLCPLPNKYVRGAACSL